MVPGMVDASDSTYVLTQNNINQSAEFHPTNKKL